MSTGPYRDVWRIAFTNFLNSFRPRQIRGNNIGKDYLGNAYFEIPADPSLGKRKPCRWYDPPKGQDFEDSIPPEWMAWLRLTRVDPPTTEEIEQNLAIAKLKKENAAKLEAKRLAEGPIVQPPRRGPLPFPKYEEFHSGDVEYHPKKYNY